MDCYYYNKKKGHGVFICSVCGHADVFDEKIVTVCPDCGEGNEKNVGNIDYDWMLKPIGYRRLIPPEEWCTAKKILSKAARGGVCFEIKDTPAGHIVMVVGVK